MLGPPPDAMRFKQPERCRGGSDSGLHAVNVWEFTSATSMHTVGQPLTTGLAVTGNTISMTVSKSAYTGLSNITSATRYYFETKYYDCDTGQQVIDYYPD
jgi:hypothetical protein